MLTQASSGNKRQEETMGSATMAKKRPARKRVKKIKLDIACGQAKQEGFTGIDIADTDDADIVHDLNVYPWPIADNSVEEAFCSHYVEHIPMQLPDGTDGLCAFMNELYRVMRKDAEVRFVYPHNRTDRAFQDPTHRRFIPESNWWYYATDWREANRLDHYPLTCDFAIANMFYSGFHGDWASRSEGARQFALQHYWNIALDVVVDLKARK